MEELKTRVKNLMVEIEFTHLKKVWFKHIIDAGIDEADARKWVTEIGHVVDEYERSLRILINLFQKNEVENIAQGLESWIAHTNDLTVWKLEEAIKELEGRYEKYLPPEPDDEDGES